MNLDPTHPFATPPRITSESATSQTSRQATFQAQQQQHVSSDLEEQSHPPVASQLIHRRRRPSHSNPKHTSSNISSKPIPPRVVQRNLPFHQSKNNFAVDHSKQRHGDLWKLLLQDWFHVILNYPTVYSLLVLLSFWTFMILVFAMIYVVIDHSDPSVNCGLGTKENPIQIGPAFAFSLETCTTVGYGLPSGTNAFFEINCQTLQFVIYLQMVWSMMFNAFLFAFFYTRLGKADSRGAQVLFSKQAVVSMVDGQVRLQIRVYDMDARNPVVEAHVRLYVVSTDRPVPRPIRVLQPNDDFGGMLFMSMPTVVSHHIDVFSLLHPPVENYPIHPSGLLLRQVDSATENRPDFCCPICSESYGTYDRWVRHVRYSQTVEHHDRFPVQGTHLSIPEEALTNAPDWPIRNISELHDYCLEEVSEVVCVVEGIDPLTSGTFQALQSYRFEDIVWDADANFHPCLGIKNDRMTIDLDLFHDILVTPRAMSLSDRSGMNMSSHGAPSVNGDSAGASHIPRAGSGSNLSAGGEARYPSYSDFSGSNTKTSMPTTSPWTHHHYQQPHRQHRSQRHVRKKSRSFRVQDALFDKKEDDDEEEEGKAKTEATAS